MTSPFVVHNGVLINGPEIAFSYEVPEQDVQHAPPGFMKEAHLRIQFRHGHSLDVPGLTAEGLKNLLDGNPF
jgi:hypothetical protein